MSKLPVLDSMVQKTPEWLRLEHGVFPQANCVCLMRRHEMSIDIATALREEAGKAWQVAERVTNPEDKQVLAQLAVRLVEIAERLERDARD
jgi:hypothetical protein